MLIKSDLLIETHAMQNKIKLHDFKHKMILNGDENRILTLFFDGGIGHLSYFQLIGNSGGRQETRF